MTETIILISAWVVMLIVLIILDKEILREAQLVYLFKQFLTAILPIVAQYT